MEVSDGAQSAVPPGGIARAAAHGAAALAFGHQAAVHGGAHHFDTQRHQRVEIVIERIAERRDEDHRAGRSRLVVVVHDLRKPFQEQLAIHVGGFLHVRHVEIAIVVVAHVLRVEARQIVHLALILRADGRVELLAAAHVPVGNELLAVGIGLHEEHDVVVEQAHGLGIGAAHHLVDRFHELLRTHRLAGVQSAVDPDDGLALRRQLMRLRFADAFGQAQAARDLFVLLEILDVIGRGNDGHPLIAAFFRLADADQLHTVGLAGELLPIRLKLGVIGDHVVVTQVESESIFGCSDFGRGLGAKGGSGANRR